MIAPEVAAYLTQLPEDQRAVLSALRAVILARLPGAAEGISYAMPAYRAEAGGKVVVGYSAFARHCGIYPFSGTVIPKIEAACAGFKTSKSGVLFTPAKPLPVALVHLIIQTRLDELAAGYPPAPRH